MRFAPFLLLTLLACRQDPAPDWVDAYERDPGSTLERVAALEDPVEQEAAVMVLSEHWPGRLRALCDDLGDPGVQRRCLRLNIRTHLRTPDPVTEEPVEELLRPGAGPAHELIPLPARRPTPFPDVQADPGDCEAGDPAFHTCLELEGIDAARNGDLETAVARCRASAESIWRQECAFVVADKLPRSDDRLEQALSLCEMSGPFFTKCFAHQVPPSLPLRTRADAVDPDLYRDLVQSAQAIHRWWGTDQGRPLALTVDLYWSIVAAALYEERARLVGNPFDHLPPDAHPHLRSAIALRAATEEAPLDAAREAVARRSQDETPYEATGARRVKLLDVSRLRSRWECDLPGEEDLPAIYLLGLGPGRRPVSKDPEVDLLLASIPAMATQLPRTLESLGALARNPHPRVAWYAVMTLTPVAPNHAAVREARRSDDPLLEARTRVAQCETPWREVHEQRLPTGPPPSSGGQPPEPEGPPVRPNRDQAPQPPKSASQ